MLWLLASLLDGGIPPLSYPAFHGAAMNNATNASLAPPSDSFSLLNNALFSTGIGLMIASQVLIIFKAQLFSLWQFLIGPDAEVRVESDDESFSYLADYLAAHASDVKPHFGPVEALAMMIRVAWKRFRGGKGSSFEVSLATRSLVCKTTHAVNDSDEMTDEDDKPTTHYIPSDGQYFVTFKGSKVYFSISTDKDAKQKTSDNNRYVRRDLIANTSGKTSLTFQTYGCSHAIIKELIESAIEQFYEKQGPRTVVYTINGRWTCEWNRFAARTPRPLSSIILPSPIKDALMADIHSFLKSEEWYKNLGIPYRRGYMLHGPPGTGKSSFIFAVAGALKMNLCLVNLSMPGLTDADLSNLLSSSPKNSILVFEDVDVSMGKHVKGPRGSTAGKEDEGDDGDKKDKSSLDENETKSQVTLSGLLNSLDGIVAQEGRIVFLTTNNLASLPAALLRPGRVDRRFLFPTADADVAARLFQRFYGMDLGEEKALTLGFKIAEKLGVGKDGNGLGVAQLQGLYLRYREEPSSVLDHTDEFLAELEQDAKDADPRVVKEE